MSKCCKKDCKKDKVCPPGPRGPRGATGPQGPTGANAFIASYFDELDTPVDLPPATPVSVASVSVGTAASPARILNITATFSASSTEVPKFVDFFLRIDTVDQLGGSELTFTIVNLGQSGAITRRIAVGPGVHTINLEAQANAAGVRIDPVTRPLRDHAALLVLETTA